MRTIAGSQANRLKRDSPFVDSHGRQPSLGDRLLEFAYKSFEKLSILALMMLEWRFAGRSSNGRTADSGSAYRGSSPCLPASKPLFFLSRLVHTFLRSQGTFFRFDASYSWEYSY